MLYQARCLPAFSVGRGAGARENSGKGTAALCSLWIVWTCSRPSVCQLLAERKLEEIAQRAAKEERFRKAVAAQDAAAAAHDVAQKQALQEPVLGSRRSQQPIAKLSVGKPSSRVAGLLSFVPAPTLTSDCVKYYDVAQRQALQEPVLGSGRVAINTFSVRPDALPGCTFLCAGADSAFSSCRTVRRTRCSAPPGEAAFR